MKQYYSIFLLLLFLTAGLYSQDLPYLDIQPKEAELSVGDTIAFTAVYVDTAEQETDTTAVWSVDRKSVV